MDYIVWRAPVATEWECMECGYLHEGDRAPRRCPDCGAVENWEKVEYVDDWDEDEDESEEEEELDEQDEE